MIIQSIIKEDETYILAFLESKTNSRVQVIQLTEGNFTETKKDSYLYIEKYIIKLNMH